MTAELLASIVAAIAALVFGYIPGLRTWYDSKPGETKAAIMGLLLIITSGVVFGLSCAGLGGDLGISLTCNKTGLIGLLQVLFAALMTNQGTYLLAVRPYQAE